MFIASCQSLSASDFNEEDYLSGNWGGGRDRLQETGINFGVTYTAEPVSLVSGGTEENNAYLHNINVEIKADLDKLAGFTNTSFTFKLSSRSGENLSEKSVAPANVYGEYFQKSQEAYGQGTKPVNVQLTTKFNELLTLDYGRLVMNDVYLRSDLYCNFMNNAICGSPKGVFAPYAMNAYPDATAGVNARLHFNKHFDLLAGVYDGSWAEQGGTGWNWGLGKNGIAVIAEAQYFFDRATHGGAEQVIKLGVNHNTGEFTSYRTGRNESGYTSIYALTDWMLFREDGSFNQGLAFFASYVYNPENDVTAFPNSLNTGFVYEGLIDGRDKDKFGLLATYYEHSKYNTYVINNQVYQRAAESVFEISYNYKVTHGIELMPDIQYSINPNGSKQLDDALVLGLKINVNL